MQDLNLEVKINKLESALQVFFFFFMYPAGKQV